MFRLTVCLLFSTAAFGQHYVSPGAPSPVPMDFNDDIYNRDMRIPPSSSFIYNFEHARIDQPPQIEMREENLGKYMGRPRTTTPLPVMPKLIDQHVPEIETVHLHHLTDAKSVTLKPYPQQYWDPISSHLPATIPPAPTTPKWMDLSDESFKHHSHHQPSRHAMNTYQSPTPAPVSQWTPPAPSFYEHKAQQPEVHHYSEPMMYQPYVPPSTEYSVPAERFHEQPQAKLSSRGNHKFSWNDVAVPGQAPEVPTTTPVAMAAPQNRGPPPSIPTLSPWYDGFGK